MTVTATAPSRAATAPEKWRSPKHRLSVYGVVAIMFTAMIFDGYDITVYGAILPTLLAEDHHLGHISPAVAGTLGSYTMLGIMVGALGAGAIGDRIGRRLMMLIAFAWFSVGMAAGALATSVAFFGATRFFTGLALGVITAGGGAVIAEFAPAHRKNMFNAIGYAGIPAGGVLAALFAIWFEDAIGWRGLFLIGATPILFLLPMALIMLPESPRWLTAMGRHDRARAICDKYDFPAEQFTAEQTIVAASGEKKEKIGFGAIFSRTYIVATVLIGIMSFMAIMAVYGLNTWLPQIMKEAGISATSGLYTLVALNFGAAAGALGASKVADMIGPKPVIVFTFSAAALCMFVMPYLVSPLLMYPAIAITGMGVTGTQILIYGMTSNYYPTQARQAGMSWSSGFGRLGGVVGPTLGGVLITSGFGASDAFMIFAVATVIGAICTILIPLKRR
ncbi:aromatic acid/H+ symport family MFS transporter [Corynebacterium hindlerae]|uniref:Aromatic acid/H+ symport family MFS transporter n=1 Tax=Corynebacterium hindlerae TaxID=699041 RepID=A0A7G5FEK2_9CORY|nr:aromatic acid/H+ symport family MFS transporter [Corynebacterium hindlerae]QMV85043.1 aromatic acid/H+ symport family MFS transporter [Corynebacterium hindlerae]